MPTPSEQGDDLPLKGLSAAVLIALALEIALLALLSGSFA
jgi:hypothetical protein